MSLIHWQIDRLVNYGLQKGLITEHDKAYTLNRLLALLQSKDYEPSPFEGEELRYPAEILEAICAYALESGILTDDTQDAKDLFDTEVMNCLMPRPSEVIAKFEQLYADDKQAATDYYYNLSRNSNYIRVDRVEKDKKWTVATEYGELIITINLSKPEKDPKAIAAAKNAPQSGYPKCALCRENEGFMGSANQAARATHRLIPVDLRGNQWFLQYSPYVYYNEHCILLSGKHEPMKVTRDSMANLLEFEMKFPHYFVGSNADLPIVGGSILTHDHFQGGNYEFPMAKAPVKEKVVFKSFEDVEAGLVDWAMSVIRLKSTNKERLLDLAGKILNSWRGYSDESVGIFAFTDETPHNTITPIARRRGESFELDLVLRNNRTSEEHPLGIFHPHAEYHHIKKENIGLIEVMGLAILPPRLLSEMSELKAALLQPEEADEIMQTEEMKKHQKWYKQLSDKQISADKLDEEIQNSIGQIFKKILENAGVYKTDEIGKAAFRRFCEQV
ncbi:UDP-glucose--hexose-1-phosphate uridylyltransferase [Scatolibacter rhodanostii]|uniref:UDP-glucose--hexose-1-phosphate uridylyltransferase n=1 Tax=Scatolibacter rhodanostii TaxID=2014781 RepID=UPI000C0891DF|nr:UDP-glucose--hexose-1-phosphate uridylyltransferase [Scatolibacter rhodanostii]